MARRNPPAKWVLPDVVNPPDHICFTIKVPNNRAHIGAFYGAIFNLTSARFWQDDPDHKAVQVAKVWREIFDNLLAGPCDLTTPDIIEEMEYEMSICEQLRYNPVTHKFEGLCCGVWEPIPGQDGFQIGGPGQPGDGSPQPAPGGCITYHAQFSAKGEYLVPTVVSAGDTIQFTNAQGAGHDGTVSPWKCPNGKTFFAGACVGVGGTSGGDPAPAIDHMALIASIGGTYYPAFSGSITVPGGVSNAQITIQANDSTLTDNSGSYSLDIEVCRAAAAATWSSFLDFTTSPYDWVNAGANQGVWVPGLGWQVECLQQSGVVAGGASYMLADVGTVFPATAELTSVKAHYVSVTIGTMFPSTLLNEIYTNLPAHNAIVTAVATVGASDLVWNGDGNFDNIHTTLIVGYHAEPTGPTPACPGGTGYITNVTITGKGIKPANLP